MRAFSDTHIATAVVSIGGVYQTEGVLAAFVAESPRGVAATSLTLPLGPYAGTTSFSLLMYANGPGETLHFKFQTSDGTVVDLQERLTFEINGVEGSMPSPFMLSGNYSPPPSTPPPPAPSPGPPASPPPISPSAVDLSISLNTGWTWVSLNVIAADMSLAALFATLNPPFTDDDYIKSQFTFTQYYSGFGFYGTLTEASANTMTMYKVKKATAGSLTFSGEPVALPLAASLTPGWNYIPCPYQSATSLGVAFGSATFLSTSDTIKSQMDFATYYENFGWFGQLGSLTPGEGYKMKLIAGGGMAFPDV